MIIVHHTGGPTIGGAINTFLSSGEATSAHYLIDADGQVLKMVQDEMRANHAGLAYWGGAKNINSISIGIEIVNATGNYPMAQYTALLLLIARLQSAYVIEDDAVVGHSDIAVNAHGVLGRKSGDPGSRFEWTRLERDGIGLQVSAESFPDTIYSGFFRSYPGAALAGGDNDNKRIFGGHKRGDFKGSPVHELQTDLAAIGYSVGTPDGDYGDRTEAAVTMFQEHFFAGGRGHKSADGDVDFPTAQLIKKVAP